MSNKNITIKEFEELAAIFNKKSKVRSIKEIIVDPSYYDLVSTEFDDYFTLSLESSSSEAVNEARDYLIKEKVYVLSSVDNYGAEKIASNLDNLNFKHPTEELGKTIDSLWGKEDNPDIGLSQGKYYFLLVPASEKAQNLSEFIKLYFEKIKEIAIRHKISFYLEADQMDGHVEGGYYLNDSSKEKNNPDYNIKVFADFSCARTMYISAAMIYRVSQDQKEFDECRAQLFYDDGRPFATDIKDKKQAKAKKPTKQAKNKIN